MKKILLIAALLFTASIAGHAQAFSLGGSFTSGSAPVYYTSLDTVSNGGTTSKTYTAICYNRYQSVTFQTNMLKISGTTSAVTVKIYGAVAVYGGTPQYVLLYTDTMADASGNYSHVITGSPYTHFQIVVTNSGTQSSSYQVFALLR